MSQKVLIAFDDSDNAMRAVEYVAKILEKDCRITLFSVVRTPHLFVTCTAGIDPYFKTQQDSFCV